MLARCNGTMVPTFCVAGNSIYIPGSEGCTAYALPSLRKLWNFTCPEKEEAARVAVDHGLVYLVTAPKDRESGSSLICLDSLSGRRKWSLPRNGLDSPIAVDASRIYVALKPQSVSAVDKTTRQVLWTVPLRKAQEYRGTVGLDLLMVKDGVVFANSGSTSVCLEANSGSQKWVANPSYMIFSSFVVNRGLVWLQSQQGDQVREIKTGKIRWQSISKPGFGYSGEFGGNLITVSAGNLLVRRFATGKIVRSYALQTQEGISPYETVSDVGNRLFVFGQDKTVILTPACERVWLGDTDEAIPPPCWTDGKVTVTYDGNWLRRYVHGEPTPMPRDKRGREALARDLASRIVMLDSMEKKRLQLLGTDAFQPLIGALIAILPPAPQKREYPFSTARETLREALENAFNDSLTPDLLSMIDHQDAKAPIMGILLRLLALKGDERLAAPYFLKMVTASAIDRANPRGVQRLAFEYLLDHLDSRSSALFIELLKDPKAAQALRSGAYCRLAGTGESSAVAAVLAERHPLGALRSLDERVGMAGDAVKVIGQYQTSDGKTWGLIQSGALGNESDLWLALNENGVWTHALFTGVSTSGPSKWAEKEAIPQLFQGKTAKELEASWTKLLIGNPELSRDSDGDGLTDIEEARLQTDTRSADTDGDGLPDTVDPWPNAAGQPVSDAEMVLAAAFDSQFHFDTTEAAGIFTAPKDMKPFQMSGRRGPTIWLREDKHDFSTPLEQCYESGLVIIQFDDLSRGKGKPWQDRLIKWNRDHTEASVRISTYSGGLNGQGVNVTVKRFGNDWLVIKTEVAYVS